MEPEKTYSQNAVDEILNCAKIQADMLKERISELESIQINFPQIFFAVKWMCKNINTERVDHENLIEIKKLADSCHVSYLTENQ